MEDVRDQGETTIAVQKAKDKQAVINARIDRWIYVLARISY
jgi:hypothetical protein